MSGFSNNQSGPIFPSPIEWSNLFPGDLGDTLFRGGGCIRSNDSNIRIIYDDTVTHIEDRISSLTSIVTPFGNSSEESPYSPSIIICISRDGAKIQKEILEKKKVQPSDNEILVFIEDNTGDTLTDAVLHIMAGEKAKEFIGLSDTRDRIFSYIKLSDKHYNLLLGSAKKSSNLFLATVSFVLGPIESAGNYIEGLTGVEIAPLDYLKSSMAKISTDILDGLVEWLKTNAKMGEIHWNPKAEKYKNHFKKKYDWIVSTVSALSGKLSETRITLKSYMDYFGASDNFIMNLIHEFLGVIDGIVELIQNILGEFSIILKDLKSFITGYAEFNFAVFAGLWNGFVDLAGGILGLISLLIKGDRGLSELSDAIEEDPLGYWTLFKEYFENMVQAFKSFSLTGLWTVIKEKAVLLARMLPADPLAAIGNVNPTKIGYYLGYIGFNILELFFPYTKLAKVRKVGDLSKVAESFADNLGKAVSVGRRAGQGILNGIEALIEFIKKGNENFKRLINDLYEAIVKVLVDIGIRIQVSTVFFSSFYSKKMGASFYVIAPFLIAGADLASTFTVVSLATFGKDVVRFTTQSIIKRIGVVGFKIIETQNGRGVVYGEILLREDLSNREIMDYLTGFFKNRSDDTIRRGLDELTKNLKELKLRVDATQVDNGLLHMYDDVGRLVGSGTKEELGLIKRVLLKSSKKKVSRVAGEVLGKEYESVILDGVEVFRGSREYAKKLYEELTKRGAKVSEDWLNALDDIKKFRAKHGLEPHNLVLRTGENGTVSKLIVEGDEFYGMNTTLQKIAEKTKDVSLRKEGLSLINRKLNTNYKFDKLPFLTHAEALSLLKAWKNGKIKKGAVLDMYVDRQTCGFCLSRKKGLALLEKALDVKLNIYNSQTLEKISR